MTLEEKFNYWINAAEYDLNSAEKMLESGRWFYVVFMCQQAIEKIVKGLYLFYIDDNIPRLHDINVILERFNDKLPKNFSDEQLSLFDTLSKFYLKSRYPDYTSSANALITKEEAANIHNKSKEAFQWLMSMKP